MAVNETTGEMIQVSEGGYTGMHNIARKSMKLYFMRDIKRTSTTTGRDTTGKPLQIIEVDPGKLLADSKAGTLKQESAYQRICGTTPPGIKAGGDMALDGDEERVYFRAGREEAARHLPADTKLEKNFGPRNMGAGPSGIASMNIRTGKINRAGTRSVAEEKITSDSAALRGLPFSQISLP